jgi:mannose-6-phosphate isomerase-like protein (cupin superfamily)
MKVNRDRIGGKITKDNETYLLEDNNLLNNLTLSKTTLKPKMCTNGHSHDDLEEVYFFQKGRGRMQLGEDIFEVKADDIVLIPAGVFHKVFNDMHIPMEFVCVFEKYDRESDTANYAEDQNEIPFAD